ncbi:MAG: acyltransferase, partial [Firmicutes bacterium]|nr:acyltransferase [Bacillota bacterium]
MLLLVTAWVALREPGLLPSLRGELAAAFFYVSNWWDIFRHVSYFSSFLPDPFKHLWSLAVEEQFYLLWPLIAVLILKTGRPWLQALLTVLLALLSAAWMAWLYHPGTVPNRVYYGTDTRAFALLIGAALAFLWPSRSLAGRRGWPWWLDLAGAAGLAGFLALTVASNAYQTWIYRGGMLGLAVAAAAIDAAVACRLEAVCSVRWLRSRLPVATSSLAVWMLSALCRTRSTMVRSDCCMSASERMKAATSSWPRTSMSVERSP